RYPRKRWVIPRVLPGNQMAFHPYDPAKLILHTYGMWEPSPDCSIVSPTEIDLALVPGLAFDAQGWRLGFGGGFYDRFLCDYTGVTLGIAYHSLFIERVPYGEYDIPMRFVVTEEGVHKVG
ncbi:MAG: 5-formyltetrahydrofolate cyclo-ligase, partial [Chloroflexota bacterium]|nr:5-formyltetrahydrofolate cyclo-ligase [Chloroflexota bacterium]